MEHKPDQVVHSAAVRPWPRHVPHKYERVVAGTESEEIYDEIQTFLAFRVKMFEWFHFIEKHVTLTQNEKASMKMVMYRLPSQYDLLDECGYPDKVLLYNAHYTEFSNYSDQNCRTNMVTNLREVLRVMAEWSPRVRERLRSADEVQQYNNLYAEARHRGDFWTAIAGPKIAGHAYSRKREETGRGQESLRSVKKKK